MSAVDGFATAHPPTVAQTPHRIRRDRGGVLWYRSIPFHGQTWFLTGCLLLAAASSAAAATQPPQTAEPSPAPPTVELTIDYGDGMQKRFPAVPWQAKMTVRDALEFAKRHPRGIRYKHRGSGATALLWEVDGLANGGARGRNWIFFVNHQLGDRSFATTSLSRGDAVLWKYDEFDGR